MDNIIGVRIRMARNSKELTREQVGRQIGVSQQQVSRYESGENKISADKLAVLATVLNKPIDYFHLKHSEQYMIGDEDDTN